MLPVFEKTEQFENLTNARWRRFSHYEGNFILSSRLTFSCTVESSPLRFSTCASLNHPELQSTTQNDHLVHSSLWELGFLLRVIRNGRLFDASHIQNACVRERERGFRIERRIEDLRLQDACQMSRFISNNKPTRGYA